jgi:outer membrane protein
MPVTGLLYSTPTRPARRALFLLALAVFPAAGLAQAPTTRTLSLEEAVARARTHNPDYLAQENDRRGTRAAVRAARADFLPSASASSSFGYIARGERRFGSVAFAEQPDYYSSSFNLGLSYDLSGAKLMQPSIARAQDRATEQRIAGAAASLASQVTQQYLSVLQGEEDLAQAEREVARAREHERLARARLEVGAGIPLDVRRAEVQRGQAEVRLLQARNALSAARLHLGQLLGAPLEPGVKLSTAFAVFEPHWQADELLTGALERNPTLRAARAGASAAGTTARAARSTYLPTLSFNVGVSGSVYRAGDLSPLVEQGVAGAEQRFAGCQQGNALARLLGQPGQDCSPFAVDRDVIRRQVEAQNSGYPFDYTRQPLNASLTLSLPLFNGLAREQRIEEARVTAEDAEHQVRAQEMRLRVEIGTALGNLETTYRTAELQEQVRQKAEEELRLARERFRFGAASSVEVIDAQTSLAQAEQAKIAAVYDFHRTLAALEALVGGSLR